MADNILKVENLSKLYKLGTIGTGSLKHDLERWWLTKIRRKEDPYLKMAEENIKDKTSDNEYVWALKDINFEVRKGEVLGIIGRNGAGKSTLLKILSRITRPTSGTIKGNGRIASLLEVGTGFHEDLTGRENIYINGNILGMNKKEIDQKFDAIVDFAGILKYIDTPVKRYSSGMYVRLAFAVAAHLEPDILIVDEVLAVGDAEFQKKCLGKMRDVSRSEGRTVLFVSHNMQAVKNLCTRAILLKNGKLIDSGSPEKVINTYLNTERSKVLKKEWKNPEEAPGNESVRLKYVELIPQVQDSLDPITIRTPLRVKFEFWNFCENINLMMGLHLFTLSDECIFDVPSSASSFSSGVIECECLIPGDFLNDGSYYISIILVKDTSISLFYFEECLTFEVEDFREGIAWYGKWIGYVRPKFNITMKMKEDIKKE